MKKLVPLLVVLWLAPAYAQSPTAIEPGECGAIRLQIQAQTGILAAPDTALLQQIGAHSQCRFSSAEVYRAGFGDKPTPANSPSNSNRQHHDDD